MAANLDFLVLVASVALGCAAGMTSLVWLSRLAKAPLRDNTVPAVAAASADPVVFVFQGRELCDLSDASGLFDRSTSSGEDDWAVVAQSMSLRFPDFPDDPDALEQGETTLSPPDPLDRGFLVATRDGENVRLVLHGDTTQGISGSVHHQLQNALIELRYMRNSLAHTPNPIWISDKDSRIQWANRAYVSLARNMGYPASGRALPALFEPLAPEKKASATRRDCLPEPGGDVQHWYSLCAVDAGPRIVTYALNIDTVVNAEIAQRNFVQTLTKTFAHLAIGLAIFNRDRQLALFNPALVDLTELPVDFLSARPTILCFFDMLREKQMMPEPKNYSSWRERIGTLVAAASDGTFQETWSLASGQTYRVTGRPHPDGAVAFMFEDISHEVSLTRSFRSELALGNAVLDQMDAAMAVFSADGVLAFSNAEFRATWRVDPDSAFADTTIGDAIAIWRRESSPDTPWAQVEEALVSGTALDDLAVEMRDGTTRKCRVRPLINGARLVMFGCHAHQPEPSVA